MNPENRNHYKSMGRESDLIEPLSEAWELKWLSEGSRGGHSRPNLFRYILGRLTSSEPHTLEHSIKNGCEKQKKVSQGDQLHRPSQTFLTG